MAKIISQETFDDVVKENIVEFAMGAAEAKDETIKQFEAQGINLANIIKDLSLNEESGQPLLNEAIDSLKEHISGAKCLNDESLIAKLDILLEECSKSVPHRVLASKNGAVEVLQSIINNSLKINPVPLPVRFLRNFPRQPKMSLSDRCVVSDHSQVIESLQFGGEQTAGRFRSRNVAHCHQSSRGSD